MRFIIRWLAGTFIRRIAESEYRIMILLFIDVILFCVGIYTIWFNFKDFGHMTMTQIVGLIIIIPLTLIFFLGAILIICDSKENYAKTLAGNAGEIDEEHPMYKARHIGKTIFEEVECDVYLDKEKKCFLQNNVTGSQKYGKFYIRYIKQEELGEVYYIKTVCHYKGHTFSYFGFNRKCIVLNTMDYQLATELNFKTAGKFEYELNVPMDEVKLEKVKVVVHIEEILNPKDKK